MDMSKIANEVTKILVQSQFAFWVEGDKEIQTDEQIFSQHQRAINYYLGSTEEPFSEGQIISNKFRTLIHLQVCAILRILEENQD